MAYANGGKNGRVTIPVWLLAILVGGGAGTGGLAAWQTQRQPLTKDAVVVAAQDAVEAHTDSLPHITESQYRADIQDIKQDLREIRRLLSER